jgi:hypothetical protein
VLIFTSREVLTGIQGWVTDLVKSVTRQVVAGQPSLMAGRPRGFAFTDFRLRIPCYHILECVTVKLTRERLQSGAGQPGGLAGKPPPGPLVSGLCTLPPHVLG